MSLEVLSNDVRRSIFAEWLDVVDVVNFQWSVRMDPKWDKEFKTEAAKKLLAEFRGIGRTDDFWVQNTPLRLMCTYPLHPDEGYDELPDSFWFRQPSFSDTTVFSFFEEMTCLPSFLIFEFLTFAQSDKFPWLCSQLKTLNLRGDEWWDYHCPRGKSLSWLDYPALPSVTHLTVMDRLTDTYPTMQTWGCVEEFEWYSNLPIKASFRHFPQLRILKLGGRATFIDWESATHLTHLSVGENTPNPPNQPIPTLTDCCLDFRNSDWRRWLCMTHVHLKLLEVRVLYVEDEFPPKNLADQPALTHLTIIYGEEFSQEWLRPWVKHAPNLECVLLKCYGYLTQIMLPPF